MFYSTPDIPDTRPWYKSMNKPLVFEENARYVAKRVGHTIIYEFNTTLSDDATTIASNLKEKFAYIKQEKKLGDNNKGLFIVVAMLTIFLISTSCCYCIYYRCLKWCIRSEWKKHRRNPKYMFNENTVKMVDLAVYMEQGLADVPKPRGRVGRKDKYKKTVTGTKTWETDNYEMRTFTKASDEEEQEATGETQTDSDDLEDHDEDFDEDDEEDFSDDEEESSSFLENPMHQSTENMFIGK
ncbi:hypothetical protein B9Z55_023656 [Caenorhabditis nigoni]|uniref:Uncharacterized protein n=2 Tax=Caenorhabditis nigoni TaxID=1611254 RepID=A0A2G5SQM4_9PELO|nr:hypothetical protein B9Z55_023656 [Caenorhabditis nigoni]